MILNYSIKIKAQAKSDLKIEFINTLSNVTEGVFTITSLFKSNIAVDTSKTVSKLFIDNNNQIQYLVNYSKNTIYSIAVKENYSNNVLVLYAYDNQFSNYKFKNSALKKTLDKLPFHSSQIFNDFYNSKLTSKSDTSQTFYSANYKFTVTKNLEYEMEKKIYTNLGVQFEKIELSYDTSQVLLKEIEGLVVAYKKTFTKFKETNNKELKIGDIFDVSQFNEGNHQFYLIDFFYQSCLPCIKSFPSLNELDKNYTNLKIIGIDPILSDTLNMESFTQRYNLNYQVVKGYEAVKFHKKIRSNTFPFYILVNNSNKIIFIHKGILDKKGLEAIKQKL